MLDAVALEARGVHTVTIAWDTFEKAARATARMKGLPGARFVVTRGRRGADTPQDQRDKARAAAAEIAALLLAAG